ncbi:hypothetical protein NC99_41080 [Sunxiuqinia dokdonensis]|uniref:Uncharacterized protein n=1 Tax=Sunxiuqinia dokdonensis TaxID=1409788 RepID=A0A0L8V3S7_9BACT|nr:hypothetical protein NC99_41080 [Sunxiuqinia dokdonensis]
MRSSFAQISMFNGTGVPTISYFLSETSSFQKTAINLKTT